MPEGIITRLSELEAGKTYKLGGEDVSCTVFVVKAGVSPLCIVYGDLESVKQRTSAPIVMQLVGWMVFPSGDNDLFTLEQSFIQFDEQPGLAWLVGAWYDSKKERIIDTIATDPTIEEHP